MQTPDSSPRSPLAERTNVFRSNPWTHARRVSSSPSKKRSCRNVGPSSNKPSKRAKCSTDEGSDVQLETEVFDQESMRMHEIRRRRHFTVQGRLNASALGGNSYRVNELPTQSIIRSFVSSQKSDIFRIPAVDAQDFFTPPYSCAYSHAAKLGGLPLLAVATEQGPVHIYNTSKRQDWDSEQPRVVLKPHRNGVFDVAWNQDSTLLATASGDHTGCISDIQTQQTTCRLRGHRSTMKTISWAEYHNQVLLSGSRDGCISLWDLRCESSNKDSETCAILPVARIEDAHGDSSPSSMRKLVTPQFKSITSLIWGGSKPFNFLSSCSYDGHLRIWDIRNIEAKTPLPLLSTPMDPTTTLSGFKRPRGIVSLTLGSGPTTGLLFGLAADARIHTYNAMDLSATDNGTLPYTNPQSGQPSSYYIRIRMSPCGRWLASGSARGGQAYVWDVANAARARCERPSPVALSAQSGEVGPVDWAEDALATCADEGTVTIWRPDARVARHCRLQPDEAKWNYWWANEI